MHFHLLACTSAYSAKEIICLSIVNSKFVAYEISRLNQREIQ